MRAVPPRVGAGYTETMLIVNAQISIPEDELEEQFIRSPGPGGQHVNKAATGVQLRFDVARSPSLPEPVRARLLRLGGRQLTREGVLVIEVTGTRSQARNRAEARERLRRLIERATVLPRPRRPTRPGRAAIERRLAGKRQRSLRKQRRSRPDTGGDA